MTEYRFTRFISKYNKVIETHAISHFSYTEAVAAGFFEKDTYKKYPRIMIGHRAFTLGARDIASDVLMGVLEDSEAALINGDDYTIDDAEYVEVSQD